MIDSQILAQLPTSTGCYLFKNEEGKVIYVGKAKNLKSRVKSYFQQHGHSIKTQLLVEKIKHVEFILTHSDAEAFVLENNLIKKHSPRYNIRLRDDKTYPYVVVDLDEPFPTLRYVRRPKRKKSRLVFGPYPVGSQIFDIVRLMVKTFGLRDCSLEEFKKRKNPCLLYQMKQCLAPCVGLVTPAFYENKLMLAIDLIRGRSEEALNFITQKMEHAATGEEFELAAQYRDTLQTLKAFVENFQLKSVEFHNQQEDVDVIGLVATDSEVDVVIYMIRNGLLLGNKSFFFSPSELQQEGGSELYLTQIFRHYWECKEDLPQEILLNSELLPETKEERDLYQQVFAQLPRSPQLAIVRKEYRGVQQLAQQQGHDMQKIRSQVQDKYRVATAKLADLLQIKSAFARIECYDVANWQGDSPTSSMITFEWGSPRKDLYRYFHLNKRPEGQNDFAMLVETMERRVKKGELPDLFLLDGGAPQVRAVKGFLDEQGINVPVVGIAKDRGNGNEERLVIPGRKNPFPLSRCPPLWNFLAKMRDEAHRFSRILHHHGEKKRLLS